MSHSYIPGPEQSDVDVTFTENHVVAGCAIGILVASVCRPAFPGNVYNASSYGFPVLYHIIKERITYEQFIKGDPKLLRLLIEGGKELIEQGVRAVVGGIGYFGHYQRDVAAALDVPVFLSSLLQIPMIAQSLRPDQKVGVIEAFKGGLSPKLLDQCGIHDNSRVVSTDVENLPEYQRALKLRGSLNSRSLEKQLVALVKKFCDDHPEVGAILLECGEMPVYSWAVQNAVRIPVFDYLTLINWIQRGVVRSPVGGFI